MAAPSIPKRTNPLYAAVRTAPPLLQATCLDSDQANTRVFARLKSKNNRILTIVELANTAGANYAYQTRVPGASQVVNFKVAGTPASGTFTYSLFGAATNPMPWSATAADVQTALEGLPDLNPGDVLVSGRIVDPGGVTITLRNNRVGIGYLMHDQLGWWGVSALKNSSGTVLSTTRTIVTQGGGEFPFSGGYGDWRWDAISFRDLYSGDTRTQRDAAAAGNWPFWIAAVPAVTVSRPTAGQVFTGSAPLFQWTVDNDVAQVPIVYQEINYVDDATDEQVWTWATAAVRPTDGAKHPDVQVDLTGDPQAREYRLPHRILRNGRTYRVSFRVINAAGQERFITRTISIAFVAPSAPASFAGVLGGGNAWVDLSWGASADADFRAYVVRMRPDGAAEGSATDLPIATITDRATTTLRSLDIPFNVASRFSIAVEVERGGEQLQSTRPSFVVTAKHTGTVLSTLVFPRKVVTLPARRDRETATIAGRDVRVPWSRSKPVVKANGNENYRQIVCTYPFLEIDDRLGEGSVAMWDRLMAIFGTNDLFLYRDAKRRMYVRIIDVPTEHDLAGWNYEEFDLTFVEQDAPEGFA